MRALDLVAALWLSGGASALAAGGGCHDLMKLDLANRTITTATALEDENRDLPNSVFDRPLGAYTIPLNKGAFRKLGKDGLAEWTASLGQVSLFETGPGRSYVVATVHIEHGTSDQWRLHSRIQVPRREAHA